MLKKPKRWRKKWSKGKTLEDKLRTGWPFFHKLCEKYYQKSCKYLCNNSTKQEGKKISTSHYRSKFWAQQYGDKSPKKAGKPWREKCGTPFMQAWCQKDLPTLYQRRTCRQTHVIWTPRDHLDYRRRDNILWLRFACDYASGTRTFHTSPFRKCQKTYRKTFWLLIF